MIAFSSVEIIYYIANTIGFGHNFHAVCDELISTADAAKYVKN